MNTFFIKELVLFLGLFLSISKSTIELNAQIPVPARGKIIRFENFKSTYVDSRHVDIWLPESYSSENKYPVLYMHDGQMLFDSLITWNHQEWKVDETLQQIFDEHQAKPFIVVGIWNNGRFRNSEYIPKKVIQLLPDSIKTKFIEQEMLNRLDSDNYLRFITEELKPAIDSAFSTWADAANTYIAGSSKGGLISLYAICEYPKIFASAACISTHSIGSIKIATHVFPYALVSYLKMYLPASGSHHFYFDHGTLNLDAYYKPYQEMINQVFRLKGYSNKTYKSIEFHGSDHTESSWAERFSIPILFLMNKE
jgi:hypothetical protein